MAVEWSKEDDQYLRDNRTKSQGELARALGRTQAAVRRRLVTLGLKKPPAKPGHAGGL